MVNLRFKCTGIVSQFIFPYRPYIFSYIFLTVLYVLRLCVFYRTTVNVQCSCTIIKYASVSVEKLRMDLARSQQCFDITGGSGAVKLEPKAQEDPVRLKLTHSAFEACPFEDMCLRTFPFYDMRTVNTFKVLALHFRCLQSLSKT